MILLQGQGLARTFADEVPFENITIHIQEIQGLPSLDVMALENQRC